MKIGRASEPSDVRILLGYVYEAVPSMDRFGWAAAPSIGIFAVLFVFAQVFLSRTNATESVYQRPPAP